MKFLILDVENKFIAKLFLASAGMYKSCVYFVGNAGEDLLEKILSSVLVLCGTLPLICLAWLASLALTIQMCWDKTADCSDHPGFEDDEEEKRENVRNIVISKNYKEIKSQCNENLDTCCSICLSEYQDGDVVCASPNVNCSHVFHLRCAEEWLIKKDECPCCRSIFLLRTNQIAGLANPIHTR